MAIVRTYSIAMAFFLAASATPAVADHSGDRAALTKVLTLDALLAEAMENNAMIKEAVASVAAKEANIAPSSALEDPMLSYEVAKVPTGSDSRGSEPQESKFTLSQKLSFPGKLSSKGRAAERLLEAERQVESAMRNEVTRDIKKSFFSLYVAFKRIDTLKDRRKLIQQIFSVAKQNFTTGKIPKVDLLNLQIDEANVVDQSLMAERELEKAFGDISHLIGRKNHTDYLFGKPEELRRTEFDLSKHSEMQLSELGKANSPKALAATARLAVAHEEITYSKLDYLPDLQLEVGYSPKARNSTVENGPYYSGLVGVSLPVWAGVKQSDLRKKALAEKLVVEAKLAQEGIEVSHELHLLYSELEENERRQQLFDTAFIPLSKQAVASAQSTYLAGKAVYSTLLESVNKRFEAEIGSVEVFVKREMILAEIEYIIGVPLKDIK